MDFYTNVVQRSNNILVCGYNNGKRYKQKIRYKPYLFIPTNKYSKYRTIDGKSVGRVDFDSIGDCRRFIDQYKDVDNFEVYGSTNHQYVYINDTYTDLKFDSRLIKTMILDIEVSTEHGYPDIQSAQSPITAITMMYDDITFVLGFGNFKTDDQTVKYIKCKDELELLNRFIKIFSHDVYRPDVVTGWNVEFFDIPYCVNRIVNVLGETFARKLSPFEILEQRTIEYMGHENIAFTPVGVNILDYLHLYKKFTYSQQESYKLDHIAFVELGERKLDYSEYGSLHKLYVNDHQMFIDYNIRDCALIRRLDDKMKLLDLVYTIAYDTKTNYIDSLATVRSWDVAIHNYLINQNVVVPNPKRSDVVRQPVGAHVKNPQTGMFDWVVSFDLTSLYPHLIMSYNISPDTFRGKLPKTFSVDQLLDGKINKYHKYLDDNNFACAASGCLFTKEKQGFLPALMKELFDKRKQFKNKMLELKKQYEKTKTKELEYQIAMYDNLQMAMKIRLNSAYGALANAYFRWFDLRYAESITMSGQLTIRWAEKYINQWMNDTLKTSNVDYVIASDTDSLYINMGEIVRRQNVGSDKLKAVEYLDQLCNDQIQPFLDEIYQKLADQMRCYWQGMHMKREGISDRGIFVAKKRYILNVHNNEGIQFDKPKLKVMGIEAVRSSTPACCRQSLKDALHVILQGTEQQTIEFIDRFRTEFKRLPFEDVAFPRGVNGLDKYHDSSTIYKKATPIHVRGALLFNHKLKQLGLDGDYQPIFDREKIKFCYLKMPNPLHENVISCNGKLPKQLGLDQYIDYDAQFDKAFVEPIKNILDVIGWKTEKTNTLKSFFK